MKTLIRVVVLLLLASQALAQNVLITVRVAGQDGQALKGVKWHVEGMGWDVNVAEESDGGIRILLPDTSTWRDDMQLAVSLTSATSEFEQVNWILNAKAARNPQCRRLDVSLRPNRKAKLTPDTDDIDTLDSYYNSDGRSLYLILSSAFATLSGVATEGMIESFEESIIDYLQTLPVIPPPKDITVPADVFLEWIDDLEIDSGETRKVWLFGSYLEALAMINGRVVPDTPDNAAGCIHFDYQLIPFQNEFGLVREVMSYPQPDGSESLRARDYDEISERWGFYTLLALCVHELVASESKSAGDRSGLERIRAYLVAERSKLGPDEPLNLKRGLIEKLLEIVDAKLGKAKSLSLLKQRLKKRSRNR